MKKFQFKITQGFVNTFVLDTPFIIEPSYHLNDGKVVLFDLDICPALFPFIKNNYELHDAIYKAAEQDALSAKLLECDIKIDIFKEMFSYFQPVNVQQ